MVVVTGNLEKISGDGRVFLTIYGNTRESEKLFLDQSNNSIPFQRNQSDVFRIATNSVGAIRKIWLVCASELSFKLKTLKCKCEPGTRPGFKIITFYNQDHSLHFQNQIDLT